MSFRCKFNFEVNGIDYFIQREGKADKKGNVKVEVKFYKMENGNESPLNGEARRSTNDIIRDYVGTYEDFILTVLSIQNSKVGSFIDLGQTERKDLLCQFMGLDVFDQLYTIANDKFKETNILLKYTKRPGQTSYGFAIPQKIAPDVLANIDTITKEVKQKLLAEQSALSGSF
jgi:DNA repair exonuclease SbcCD ATPase subunit